MMATGRCVLTAVIVLVAAAGTAAAQDDTLKKGDERPWAKGVSAADQKTALALFREGNKLLKEDSLFKQAVEKYKEALEHWDHPAIHYNLAVALVNLDQPVEAYEHFEKALAYGAAPLDEVMFEHGKRYSTLLEGQLARIAVTCDLDGAKVTMDGKPLFTAPGKFEGWVRAGPHSIVASKEGYLSTEKSQALPAAKTTTFELKLFRAQDLTRYRRKWAAWKPWVVAGGGAALLVGAGLMHWQAQASFDAFDRDIEACGGCVPTEDQLAKRDRGELLRTFSFVSYGIGGALLVGGAALVYINRERPYQVAPEHDVSVVPVVGPTGAGVVATFHF